MAYGASQPSPASPTPQLVALPFAAPFFSWGRPRLDAPLLPFSAPSLSLPATRSTSDSTCSRDQCPKWLLPSSFLRLWSHGFGVMRPAGDSPSARWSAKRCPPCSTAGGGRARRPARLSRTLHLEYRPDRGLAHMPLQI